jgi:hypothetical protein
LIVYTYPRENIKKKQVEGHPTTFRDDGETPKVLLLLSFLLCYDVVKYIYLLSHEKEEVTIGRNKTEKGPARYTMCVYVRGRRVVERREESGNTQLVTL